MMALVNPTVNAYRRINPEALVPTRCCWGHDHRMALVRVPKERGEATRLEYDLPEELQGKGLPQSFEEALGALEADPMIVEALGSELIDTFRTVKGPELERFRGWVTDWEFSEYAERL